MSELKVRIGCLLLGAAIILTAWAAADSLQYQSELGDYYQVRAASVREFDEIGKQIDLELVKTQAYLDISIRLLNDSRGFQALDGTGYFDEHKKTVERLLNAQLENLKKRGELQRPDYPSNAILLVILASTSGVTGLLLLTSKRVDETG